MAWRASPCDRTAVFGCNLRRAPGLLVEIILCTGASAISVKSLGLGEVGGMSVKQPLDFLYFSIVTYTSLGFSDIFSGGHLRFIASVETLNGLLLIIWSGSFIYLAMGRL